MIYSQFPGKTADIQGLPHVQLHENRKLKYEDVYPVLYLKYRLAEPDQARSGIKHLVVDEMQDYSRLQYLILQNDVSLPYDHPG